MVPRKARRPGDSRAVVFWSTLAGCMWFRDLDGGFEILSRLRGLSDSRSAIRRDKLMIARDFLIDRDEIERGAPSPGLCTVTTRNQSPFCACESSAQKVEIAYFELRGVLALRSNERFSTPIRRKQSRRSAQVLLATIPTRHPRRVRRQVLETYFRCCDVCMHLGRVVFQS